MSRRRPAKHTWVHKLGVFLFIIVCFEVGVFLLCFPGRRNGTHNSLASLTPGLRDVWISSYFRGALSGLGLLNIYISLAEVARLPAPAVADRLKVSTL